MILSSNNQCFFQIEESSGIDSIVLDIGLGIEKLSSLPKYYNVGYNESPKILEFETLVEGWHFGEGTSIKKEIIQKALKLDKKAYEYGYFETDAFPGIAGEIMVTIYYNDDYFEFTIEENEMVSYLHEFRNEEIKCEENISFDKALKKIEEIKEEICSLSEFFISDIGILGKGDLKALPLKTTAVFPFYAENALIRKDELFVGISSSSTQQLSGAPLYIGDSQSRYYHAFV